MPEKLIIRVVNTPKSKPQTRSSPKEIVEYRWDRIVAVSLLAVIMSGALIWKMWPSSAEERRQAPRVAENTTPIVGLSIQATPTTAKVEKTGGQALAKLEPAPQQVPTLAPAAPSANPPLAEAAARPNVAIYAKHLKRVQLTGNILAEEPMDALGAEIPMNSGGLVRVYLFMESVGLKGNVLYHDWFLNGKRMAHIRVPVKRHENKAASSKFINRTMLGQWEAKVTDGGDRVLAKAVFNVK